MALAALLALSMQAAPGYAAPMQEEPAQTDGGGRAPAVFSAEPESAEPADAEWTDPESDPLTEDESEEFADAESEELADAEGEEPADARVTPLAKSRASTGAQPSAAATAAALPRARGNTLNKGQRLARGMKIVSENGRHSLLVSKKGNLRVTNWGRTRWNPGSKVKGRELKITGSGRLVLTSGSRVVWRAKAKNIQRVTIGDNGNLVAKSKSGKTVWNLSSAASKRLNKGRVRYFSQNDRRWSKSKFGAYNIDRTGCLPTSFAMAISAFRPRVSPKSVAKYMWNHGDYNHVAGNKKRGKFGAGAYSIEVAAKHYGVMASPLKSRAQINRALKQGRTVIALERGPSTFTGGKIHVVVLSGYSKGKTTVIDPWMGRANRVLTTKFVWSWRTHEKQYRHRGSAFWAIG